MAKQLFPRVRRPALDPETRYKLGRIVGELTQADEGRRRAAVARVLHPEARPILSLLAHGLIDRLRGRVGAVGRRATASLVEMGEPILATLSYRFLTARNEGVQARLAGVLGEIGGGLPVPRRAGVLYDLLTVAFASRSENVVKAVFNTCDRLRQPTGCRGRRRSIAHFEHLIAAGDQGDQACS